MPQSNGLSDDQKLAITSALAPCVFVTDAGSYDPVSTRRSLASSFPFHERPQVSSGLASDAEEFEE